MGTKLVGEEEASGLAGGLGTAGEQSTPLGWGRRPWPEHPFSVPVGLIKVE